MNGTVLTLALVLGGIIMLVTYFKDKRLISGILLTAIQGICAFFAVNIIGSFFGVHLNINLLSMGVSLFGGTPGVIFLLIMDTICR